MSVALAAVNIVIALKDIIVCAVKILTRSPQREVQANSLKMIKRFKLAHAPFMVYGAFALFILPFLPVFMNPWMIWFVGILLLSLPVVMFFMYMFLLATSAYAIHDIIILYRRGVMTKKQCVFHIIKQFIFLVDLVDTIYLDKYYGIENKEPL